MGYILISLTVAALVGLFFWLRYLIDKAQHRERRAEVTIADMTQQEGKCYITYRPREGEPMTCQVPEAEYRRRRVGQQGELVYRKDVFVDFLLPEQM